MKATKLEGGDDESGALIPGVCILAAAALYAAAFAAHGCGWVSAVAFVGG